jgi:hypothetical protein
MQLFLAKDVFYTTITPRKNNKMELTLNIVPDDTIKHKLLLRLVEVAEERGITPDEAAAQALEDYIERHTPGETLEDAKATVKAGMMGAMENFSAAAQEVEP